VSVAGVFEWRSELSELHARLGELFVRSEPRRQAGLYLEGLLSAVERKNGWQLAEHLGDARPWCQRRRENASARRSKNASRVHLVSATPDSAFQFA